jgi:lipoprotein-anchoring transpeptidase ErfK/SrfK
VSARRATAAGLLCGAVAGVAAVAALPAGAPSGEEPARPALPAPATHGLDIPPPRPLDRAAQWAPVRRPAVARTRPSARAPRVAALGTRTPEGTRNLVRVLGRRAAPDGRLWVRVSLAVLPNGSTGWVPRRALGAYEEVTTRLVVDRRRLRATLYDRGRVVLRARIGVGAAAWPTPRGEFYVRNRLERYRSPAYGPLAFGISARSETLTDWPAGGYVGIHGTNRPDLIPGRVSHGCIRLRNTDILRLGRLMPVGTPVRIR